MKVSIHQPNFIPWLGFFVKAKKSDEHVFLTDVAYSKNGWTNRNIIMNNGEKSYLTIPVGKKFAGKNISDINIETKAYGRELRKLIKTIDLVYEESKIKSQVLEILYDKVDADHLNLCDLNTSLIKYFFNLLKIDCATTDSFSVIKDPGLRKSDLVLEICKKRFCNEYITGAGGLGYLDIESFKVSNILVSSVRLGSVAGVDNAMSVLDFCLTSHESYVDKFSLLCENSGLKNE